MKSLIATAIQKSERVFLVGAERKDQLSDDVSDSMAELKELALTAGTVVVGEGIQKLETPHPATFIGGGKAEAFAIEARALKADTILFDDELTGAQGRNLEEIFECKVLDRTALILEIFAMRARTREGKLQVELAQLQYLLPRLTRYWTHLSRQRGGLGAMGGEGESQLEADRRRTQERIHRLKSELDVVRRQRATQRQGRQRHRWPLVSIVGYTNAGKSSLLNRLTGAEVLAEDQLFATLDPTTRRLRLPTNQNVLLSDTVGFIRKLPHGLVEAFKATLEEVVEADLLLHVVDISHPTALDQIRAVQSVLSEIGAEDKSMLMVFNKIDRIANGESHQLLDEVYPHQVFVSAKSGEGMDELLSELSTLLRPVRDLVELRIPHEEQRLISRVHAVGQVMEQDLSGSLACFKVLLPPDVRHEFESFIHPEPADP